MKSETDTQLNEDSLLIKAALAAHLAKTGETLLDFERALATGNHEKLAGYADLAEALKALTGVGTFTKGVGQLGLGASMLYGGAAGLGAYGGYKGIKDSDKKVQQAALIKQRIDLARQELEQELAVQQGQ
jgi:hypothetical protein